MILPASKVHNYNTRYATNQNLYRPASRTNYGLARFKVIASKIWETIPTEMKCLSHTKFQKEYKLPPWQPNITLQLLVFDKCYVVSFSCPIEHCNSYMDLFPFSIS